MWDTDGENWGTLDDYLWKYFEKASLRQPEELRVTRSLRSRESLSPYKQTLKRISLIHGLSVTLNHFEYNGQGAFLHFPYIFIPQLRDLTIRSFMIEEEHGKIDSLFERQTELKSLRIERSFVIFPALKKILLAPRALSYLSIYHVDKYWYHGLKNAEINHATVADFVKALLPHRLSLEEIKAVVDDDGYGEGLPTSNAPSFRDHATQFPALRRWLGCDRKTLADYLSRDGTTSFGEDVEYHEGTD